MNEAIIIEMMVFTTVVACFHCYFLSQWGIFYLFIKSIISTYVMQIFVVIDEIFSLACKIFPDCGSLLKNCGSIKMLQRNNLWNWLFITGIFLCTLAFSLERINSNCLCVPCHLIQYLEGLIYYMIYIVWYPSRWRTFLSFLFYKC